MTDDAGAGPRGGGSEPGTGGRPGRGPLSGPGPWPPTTRWPDVLHRAVAGVRGALEGLVPDGPRAPRALVGLSGGADSLALAAACAALTGTRAGAALGPVGAVVVDHGLQPGSDAVAAAAADVARAMGLGPVLVRTVRVVRTGDGPEAAARHVRREAFASAASRTGAAAVLTAHTADDRAEQVLLGLARGSGTRSLAGIPARGELPGGLPVLRPLLELTRADTEAICRWAGVLWWDDPHNADPTLLRSRVRTRILPALEDAEHGLGPGVRAALARTAALAAEDADALDAWAADAFARAVVTDDGARIGGGEDGAVALDLAGLAALPPAVRRRVLALAAAGAGAGALSRERILAVDALAVPGRPGSGGSAGPVELPGGVEAWRRRSHAGGAASSAGSSGVREGDPVEAGGPGACARLVLIRRRPRP